MSNNKNKPNIPHIKCGIKRTEIVIRNRKTGEEEIVHNKVILPGSVFTAAKHFNIAPPISLPSYNTEMTLDGSVDTPPANTEIITLFCMGIDGAGPDPTQILPEDYAKWCAPANLVPFRYVPSNSDISAGEREIYFGRKTIDTSYFAYYFKAFESNPIMYMRYSNGTSIDANIYNSATSVEVETVVEVPLSISTEDGREFFEETSSISNARVNTISLLSAWYTTQGGHKYFQNVQPITKLNFSERSLDDTDMAYDMIYRLYY